MEIHPFPKYANAESGVDRSAVPEAGAPPVAQFPAIERATLSNGLKILLAERHTVPQVNFSLQVDAGYAADQFGAAGTASMAMALLDEGTATRNALQISDELQTLGANLGSGSNLDMSSVRLSALKDNLDASLALYADVILNPTFPAEELERLRRRRLAQIQQEKAQPFGMALRVFPKLLYGEGHAYGNPFTGSGTAETVKNMTRDDMVKFHSDWFMPNNATLVVVGDTTIDEIKPKLEALFGSWKKGKAPKKNIGQVALLKKPTIYIMDRPGALQSVILAAHVAPPKANPEEIAIEAMNTTLGGGFVSRVNMNLREDKHWSYGAGSALVAARGQRPFIVFAPVQTDKTKESVAEILKEVQEIIGSRPITEDELSRARAQRVLTLSGQWETMNAVAGSLSQIVRFGFDDNYFNTYAGKVNALGLGDVNAAAKTVVHPGSLTWVVVGDREKIEAGIRELGLAEVKLMDADGNIME
jgi:zinc protease